MLIDMRAGLGGSNLATVRLTFQAAIVCPLLLACVERSDGASAIPPVNASPSPPAPATPPSLTPHPADSPTGLSSGPTRELGPIGGGTRCLEMYSACTMVDGERQCSSAPFSLECGEEARLPTTGEVLRCVCAPGERVLNDSEPSDPAPVNLPE
jgi:hypothetical protein